MSHGELREFLIIDADITKKNIIVVIKRFTSNQPISGLVGELVMIKMLNNLKLKDFYSLHSRNIVGY